MPNPLIAVDIAVLNGARYIERCLNSISKQTLDHGLIEVHILDNGSSDNTISLIEQWISASSGFEKVTFTQSERNVGMWGGQEELLKKISSPYVVYLSVDVILEENFLAQAIKTMDQDSKIGAVQSKTYQYSAEDFNLTKQTIDTCGFLIERSRRIMNIGHGETERGQYNNAREIFGVEGAVPIFRVTALESIRVHGRIADQDLFWYAEDLDVAWRLRLAGWKEFYDPNIIAWHDRGTSKSHARGSWWNYIPRVALRRQISMRRRRLGWRNTRWTRIKNDYIINILRDLPYIVLREIQEFAYTLIFEPGVFLEIPTFLRFLPNMLKKRRAILAQAKATPEQIHTFFQ